MPKRLLLIICCILLILVSSNITCQVSQTHSDISSQYVIRVIFSGNEFLDDKALSEIFGIYPGQKFDPNPVEESLYKILSEYRKYGYLFAKASLEYPPAPEDQVILNVNIHEGIRLRTGKLELAGRYIFPEVRLLGIFNDTRKSVFFSEDLLKNDIEKLMSLYSDNGYPLAKISPSDFSVEGDRLNIKIDIDSGPLVRIKQVQLNGLKKTREEVVLRELEIKSDDIFDQKKIDESQRILNNLGYFQDTRPFSFSKSENDTVIVTSEVTEGRTGTFAGLIGYSPSEEGQTAKNLIGSLEASETNLLGTGRKASIRAKFGNNDIYEFAYQEPWIMGSPVSASIILRSGSRKIDHVYNEREASLIGTMRLIKSVKGSFGMVYKQIKSPDSIQNLLEDDLLIDGKKYGLISEVQHDSRDYFANPTSGGMERFSVEFSRGDIKVVRLSLDLSHYFRTFSQQVLALGFHAGRVWGNRIPLGEMLYLGGTSSLRGYKEDQFYGTGRYYINSEYRLLVGKNSQVFLFLDGGSIYNIGFDKLKLGYGIGIRLESQSGMINVDYGIARGDSILKGKIHISLGAAF